MPLLRVFAFMLFDEERNDVVVEVTVLILLSRSTTLRSFQHVFLILSPESLESISGLELKPLNSIDNLSMLHFPLENPSLSFFSWSVVEVS